MTGTHRLTLYFLSLVAPAAHSWLAPSPRPLRPALGLQAMGARREHVRALDEQLRALKAVR